MDDYGDGSASGRRSGGRLIALTAAIVCSFTAAAPDAGALPGPIGAPIETVSGSSEHGPIKIADQSYGSGAVTVAVVDRGTLAVNVHSYDGTADDLSKVADLIKGLDEGSLVIISAPRGWRGLPDGSLPAFNTRVLSAIGAKPFRLTAPPNRVAFSVIGAPGWHPGAAYQNVSDPLGLPVGPVTDPGGLRGYLQRDPSTGQFGFVFPDYLSIDTHIDPAQGQTNTMNIAGEPVSATLPAGRSGFHLVLADRASLRVIGNRAYSTNGGPSDEADQAQFGQDLQAFIEAGRFVFFIQSIGAPRPTTLGWNQIAAGAQRLGGLRPVVNGLQGTGGYALVGSTDWPDLALESVYDAPSRQTGSISGLLARNHSGLFQPQLSDLTGGASAGALLQLAYQPASAWPERDTPGKQAAVKYIAQQLGLNVDDPNLRYRDRTLNFGASFYTDLSQMSYPGSGVAFSQEEFHTVRAELLREFKWVSLVRGWVKETEEVMTKSVILNKAKLEPLVRNVLGKIPANTTPVSVFEIYAQLFKLAGALDPAAAYAAQAFSLAATFTKPKGENLLGNIRVRADQLADELTDRYGKSLGALGLLDGILVTDHDKLQTAGESIKTGKPGWTWTAEEEATALSTLGLAAERTFSASLLPMALSLYRLSPRWQNPNDCRVLLGEPASAWTLDLSDFRSGWPPIPNRTVLALGTPYEDDRVGRMKADASLTDPLYKAPTQGGLGLFKPRFLADNFTPRGLPAGDSNCVTH